MPNKEISGVHLYPPSLGAALGLVRLGQRPSAVLLGASLPLVPPTQHVGALVGLQGAVHLTRGGKDGV